MRATFIQKSIRTIRLLRISILQLIRGDFCNKICQLRTCIAVSGRRAVALIHVAGVRSLAPLRPLLKCALSTISQLCVQSLQMPRLNYHFFADQVDKTRQGLGCCSSFPTAHVVWRDSVALDNAHRIQNFLHPRIDLLLERVLLGLGFSSRSPSSLHSFSIAERRKTAAPRGEASRV